MPSKADPYVLMREDKDLKCYEYIATYVDDLCKAAQDPGKIIQIIKEHYKLKVKGDGPLTHHLGADYTKDKDKTLVCQPKKYIDRLPPRNMRTPLETRMTTLNWMTLNYLLESPFCIISP